jgi:hypothetical protein
VWTTTLGHKTQRFELPARFSALTLVRHVLAKYSLSLALEI